MLFFFLFQSLTVQNDDLTDQVHNIRQAQQRLTELWTQQHGGLLLPAASTVVSLYFLLGNVILG